MAAKRSKYRFTSRWQSTLLLIFLAFGFTILTKSAFIHLEQISEKLDGNHVIYSVKNHSRQSKISGESQPNIGYSQELDHEFDDVYLTYIKKMRMKNVPSRTDAQIEWNFESILDAEVTEQVIEFGIRARDHITIYKPLCIDPENEETFSVEGKYACGGYNRRSKYFERSCQHLMSSSLKESLIPMKERKVSPDWLVKNSENVHWINDATVILFMDTSAGNIAHFAGRILFLQHVLDNIMVYTDLPVLPSNVLIIPSHETMKRFVFPDKYSFYHSHILQSIIYPHNFTIGTLDDFFSLISVRMSSKFPIVHLLHNLSIGQEQDQKKRTKAICFRRAIVPSLLKGRFFVDDVEYPSVRRSFQHSSEHAPPVPRDSLRFRQQVRKFLGQTSELDSRKKKILLLDRGGSRRVLESDVRKKVLNMMEKVAHEKGYEFTVTSFEGKNFSEQHDVMKHVAIAVGIHGANLVNSIFMPPLSVLIELFPFGFDHAMYINGGNSGLKYMSYTMKEGISFKYLDKYESIIACIRSDHDCKIHYRDFNLVVGKEDLRKMKDILLESIEWHNALMSDGKSIQKKN